MSASTASIADVSRKNFINKDDRRDRGGTGQTQCNPMPLPALGTQKIIQGNGTNVGTIISLRCPEKHKPVGSLTCVLDLNSTKWTGETYCKPLAFDEFGFRVAVVASIVSSAIILLMSMAFITCCLVDCLKEDKRKQQESDPDTWQWEEQQVQQQQEQQRTRFSHKSRNNNNNNTQEKMVSLWETSNPHRCDDLRACRYQQHFACTCAPAPPLSALPGCDYDQPLLPRNYERTQDSEAPPHFFRPPLPSLYGAGPSFDVVREEGPGMVWQPSSSSGGIRNESNMRIVKKESSIRIISV